MLRKMLLVLILGVFVFGNSKVLFAQTINTEVNKKAEDVGNKICPVSGEKIDEKLKATYEYQGKIYNFCCSSCIEDFKKDPEKYIKKMNEKLETQNKETTKQKGMAMPESGMSSMDMQGGNIK